MTHHVCVVRHDRHAHQLPSCTLTHNTTLIHTPQTHHVCVVRHDRHAHQPRLVALHVRRHLPTAQVPRAQLAAGAASKQERAAAEGAFIEL